MLVLGFLFFPCDHRKKKGRRDDKGGRRRVGMCSSGNNQRRPRRLPGTTVGKVCLWSLHLFSSRQRQRSIEAAGLFVAICSTKSNGANPSKVQYSQLG